MESGVSCNAANARPCATCAFCQAPRGAESDVDGESNSTGSWGAALHVRRAFAVQAIVRHLESLETVVVLPTLGKWFKKSQSSASVLSADVSFETFLRAFPGLFTIREGAGRMLTVQLRSRPFARVASAFDANVRDLEQMVTAMVHITAAEGGRCLFGDLGRALRLRRMSYDTFETISSLVALFPFVFTTEGEGRFQHAVLRGDVLACCASIVPSPQHIALRGAPHPLIKPHGDDESDCIAYAAACVATCEKSEVPFTQLAGWLTHHPHDFAKCNGSLSALLTTPLGRRLFRIAGDITTGLRAVLVPWEPRAPELDAKTQKKADEMLPDILAMLEEGGGVCRVRAMVTTLGHKYPAEKGFPLINVAVQYGYAKGRLVVYGEGGFIAALARASDSHDNRTHDAVPDAADVLPAVTTPSRTLTPTSTQKPTATAPPAVDASPARVAPMAIESTTTADASLALAVTTKLARKKVSAATLATSPAQPPPAPRAAQLASSPSTIAASPVDSASLGGYEENARQLLGHLQQLRLESYYDALRDYGVDSLDDLASLTVEDFEELGVKPFHRKKLASAAVSAPQRPPPVVTTFDAFLVSGVDGFIARSAATVDAQCYAELVAATPAFVMGRATFEAALQLPAWPYGDKRVVVLSSDIGARVPAELAASVTACDSIGAAASLLSLEGQKHALVEGLQTVQGFIGANLIATLTVHLAPVMGQGRALDSCACTLRLLNVAPPSGDGGGVVQLRYTVTQ